MNKRILVLVSLGVALALASCSETKKQGNSPSPEVTGPAAQGQAPAGAGDAQVLARLNGEAITDEDVRKAAGPKLAQAETDFYDARKEAINQVIDDKILDAEAKKQGTTKAEFLKKNVFDKIKIEDKEVEKFFEDNKAQMQGKKLEDVKGNIRGFLFRDQHQKVYGDLLAGLRKKADVEVLIHAPRVEVEEGDNPGIGPKDAPVKIIEFTDYECPFCGKARLVVNQILDEYKGKVRYVLRDFPLSFHKDSQKAHEAARCAGDQNKYWEFNKRLFANQHAIQEADLKKYGEEVKLKMDKFNECLSSGKYGDIVRKNQEYGEKVGVSGTPAFFINGRMISGARPVPSFKEIIDDELREAKSKK